MLWKATQADSLLLFCHQRPLTVWSICVALFSFICIHNIVASVKWSPWGNSWPTNLSKFEKPIIRHKLYHSTTKSKQHKWKTYYSVSYRILLHISIHSFSASDSKSNKLLGWQPLYQWDQDLDVSYSHSKW